MKIPDNHGDHGGALFSFILSVFCLFISIGLLKAKTNTHEGVQASLIVLSILFFLILLNMGLVLSRDYWIDHTGIYVRILGGKVVRRKLLTEDIRYFGVILVVSGKYEKTQIVFSKYIPRGNGRGYAIRLRGTISIDYNPELYEAICKCYTPGKNTMVALPRI